LTHPFFDPRDLVQVKYEMLHRVIIEGQPVAVTASAFGFSRVTVHQLHKRFEAEGLAGLMPRRKGPRYASKLSNEVLAFIWQALKAEPELRTADLPQRIHRQFGISIHRRSIERALKRDRKKIRASAYQRMAHTKNSVVRWRNSSSGMRFYACKC
jgi:transposase